ncbi:MAG TPA: LURP-one-related family protein [Kineosporiaceae bacterium]
MVFRERRQERREERQERSDERRGGSGAAHYRMRQKLVSIGDDYWIEDDEGRRVFKVDGKALRVRKTLDFEDTQGNKLLKIQERMLRVRDTMEIEDPDGRTVATVKKALVTPLRERMAVTVAGGPDLTVHGNILDHEYSIEAQGATVAEVSKRWFRIADTYGVEIAPGQNEVLLLAVTAVIDSMVDPAR